VTQEADRQAGPQQASPQPASPQPASPQQASPQQASPVRDGMLLGLAVGTSGLAFGAAAVSSGLSAWQACALSLLAFTGASQFALAAAVAGGGSLLAGTAGAVLLGSRNTLYGLRLAGLLRVRGGRRALTALGVIDETTAIALAQPDAATARKGFTATFASLYPIWNLATLAGAFGTSRLGSPQALGLGVVAPAAFLALIWPRLRAGSTERWVALLGAAIAVSTTPVLPVGVPVILAASAAIAGAFAPPRRRVPDGQAPDGQPDSQQPDRQPYNRQPPDSQQPDRQPSNRQPPDGRQAR
jgi:predicted branched-subunit amino acid permease